MAVWADWPRGQVLTQSVNYELEMYLYKPPGGWLGAVLTELHTDSPMVATFQPLWVRGWLAQSGST